MKKIGVDGRLLQGNLTGVGKYIFSLINFICERDDNVYFRIYTNRAILCNFNSSRVEIIRSSGFTEKIKPMVWSKLFSATIINKDKPDIFLAGDAFIPKFIKTTRIVAVVHDLNSIISPGTMPRLRLITDRLFFKNDIDKAQVIISNSYGTADRLRQNYHREVDLVIHPMIDSSYKPLDERLVKSKLKESGITFPYILSVATLEPRKNLDKTIAAFLSLKKKGYLPDHKLLLVGCKGWKSAALDVLLKLHTEDVRHLGFIPDEMMPYLYNGADLFVFPSSYEGFGMPVREAMLCNLPVVTTDIPELREASYQKAFYINLDIPDALENTIMCSISSGRKFSHRELTDPESEKQLNSLMKLLNN